MEVFFKSKAANGSQF
jgi:hypothetical protein